MTIRVLLVDDQPLLRTGFRLILEGEPDIAVVGEAGDGARAVELTRALLPEVVLMDIRMPGVDGIEATRRIVREEAATHDPRVLILTTFDLDEYVVEAVRAGASGFLLKDAPPEDLVTAIRIVAAGDAIVAPSVTRRLLDRFATRLPSVRESAPPRGLRDADRARAGGAAPRGARAVQRGDRQAARRQRDDHQDPRRQPAGQAGPARPGAGRGVRVRDGPHPARARR